MGTTALQHADHDCNEDVAELMRKNPLVKAQLEAESLAIATKAEANSLAIATIGEVRWCWWTIWQLEPLPTMVEESPRVCHHGDVLRRRKRVVAGEGAAGIDQSQRLTTPGMASTSVR